MDQREFDFIDLISILSLMLGYENLIENREQSKQNDISAANDAQAKFLLKKIDSKFEEQNQMLKQLLDITIQINGKLDDMIGR